MTTSRSSSPIPCPVSETRMMFSFSPRAKERSMRPPAGVNLTAFVDQIRHGLEQEVTVAICCCVIRGRDPQRDVLVFRDRVVEIPDLPHEVRRRDFGKAGFASAVLDLGDPQQCSYDSQRLIEGPNRPVRDGLQFLKGLGVGTTALKTDSHASERCAQIVRYLIADPCHPGDENLDFVQHAVCDYGKFVERMIEPRDRDTFAQVARHDASNESIQVCDTSLNADT